MSDEIDSDAYRITWLIRRIFRAMGHGTGEYPEAVGISTAERAVMEFLYPDRKLSVPDIARRYQVSRQHVQVTVNSMIDRDLAAATENPGHKRSPLIILTDEGRNLFDALLERDCEAIDKLFADVPQEERRQTRMTLEKLYKKLSHADQT